MRRRKKVQKRQDFYLRPSLEVFRRCICGRGSRFFAPFAAEFGPRFWSSSTLYGYCAPIRRNNVQRVEGENGLLRRRKNRILPRATRRPGAIDPPSHKRVQKQPQVLRLPSLRFGLFRMTGFNLNDRVVFRRTSD